MSKRDDAVAKLQHYFAVSMNKRSASEMPGDYRIEISEIVDDIIDATIAKLESKFGDY